ncbi:MAG TPA: hypothetical protein VE442_13200 [Jatrophihabitans sp.]|jgi:hypothetical protein|nr:hypothetical protein [Jatrophihabitans sp.]
MTAIRHGRRFQSGCSADEHAWETRDYPTRYGLRVCTNCGRAEVTLPAQRSREHLPAHMMRPAAAA